MRRTAAAIFLVLAGCSSDNVTSAPPPTFADRATAPTFAPRTPTPDEATTTSTVVATTTTAPPAPTANRPGAEPAIDRLIIAPEGSDAGYDRDLFGGGWIDADSDGCDTRCEVLAAERRTDLPGLPGGGWLSIYDGYSTSDPSELDIDHVVALGEAWRSGAAEWDPARRVAFANDLEPPALIAVTASTNRSKGDRDPANWQPPSAESWCEFTTAWVDTKVRWGLTADEAEVRALRNMRTAQACA